MDEDEKVDRKGGGRKMNDGLLVSCCRIPICRSVPHLFFCWGIIFSGEEFVLIAPFLPSPKSLSTLDTIVARCSEFEHAFLPCTLILISSLLL